MVPLRRLLLAGCALIGCLSLVLSVSACAKQQELVRKSTKRAASAAEVDADPWALLPRGAVAWGDVDTRALFAASFGQEARVFWQDRLPLSRGVVIDPEADVDRIVLGAYATVGSDVAMVVRGRFSKDRIDAAYAKDPVARHGKPIVRTQFAGFDMFVLEGIALVPLTQKTLVLGTEIGVRRVLERVESGRLVRPLPPWFEKMLASGAPLALGVDLDAQPVPAVIRTRLAFLEGLRAGRLLGNFDSPGLNLAGSLTYDRPDIAEAAAADIEAQAAALEKYAVLMSVLGIPRPLRRVQARAVGQDAQVVLEVEGRAIGLLLARAEELSGKMFE
jgi:hypothetical protein